MSSIATSRNGYQRDKSRRIRPVEPCVARVAVRSGVESALRLCSRILDIAAVAGPLVFLATAVFLEFAQPNFSPVRDTISSLVYGRFGWLQTAAFVVLGLTMIAMSIRAGTIMARRHPAILGQTMLSLMGLAFVVLAIFPTSSPLYQLGIEHEIHQQIVRVMSALFPLACMLVAYGVLPRYPTVRGYTMATAVVAMALIPVGAVAVLTDAPWLGAIERIILGNGLIWAEAMAVQVLLVTRHPCGTFEEAGRRIMPEFTGLGRNGEVTVRCEAADHLKDKCRKDNF